MYLEIEIDESGGRGRGRERERGRERQPREAEEDEEQLKMRLDRRPERDTTKTRLLRRRHRHRRARLERQSDGSASFLRAARAGNLEKVLEFLKTNTDINTCNANGLNALHLASKEGHVNVVRELLQRGANVDAATKKGNTALHIASLAGQEEIVKVLVQHQALVNIQSQNGFTPLYMAAQENHDSVVRFLLANNANQSLATEDGFTPLAVALQQGHDKVVAVLLENDTRGKVRLPALHIAAKKDDTKAAALLLHTDHNPDVTSKSGFTPLHIASHYGNENIANLLIQRGADVNYIAKHQITPLHVASKWGKGNMVSLLIDKGANYEAKTRDGLTPLHCAARSGHEAVVDMLLEKGAPITSKTKNGLAPLHMASQGDHVDAARILLYHKAPVDDVTVDFLTALHVAAHCGHVRVAKLLLDRKAEANARALNGFTPLHIACKKNRIKVVELLLKHGASIEATTESGLTPLHVASFMGCMNIVIYLLQHSATADVPTVRGETPLHLAARANQTDIIRILLRNGAQVDARAREQQTALHIASRLGNSDIVVLLLQHGAAVDATTKDHYTALHIAAKEGQEEVASVLLEHGASLTSTTKKGFTPLHLAAKYGNMKVARLLLQKDALVDAQGKNGVTPLHVAAHYDHQNVALLLLDKGASPHATAKNGYTPLHIAARKNQMDIATTLLEYGASANAESKAGFTPLHLSSQEGHTDMATLLIEHNAAPGACAKNGLTPLHLCGQEDRVNVAAILVKHGAQIDPVTKAGYTPLHVACHFGQMNMVRFLLQHGAKVNSTTQLGYTPLHQAAQQGHTQIVNLLLENKAEPNTETNDGKTALSIAQRLGYISVVETLKIVTETTINTTTTTTTEEKYKVVVPETMHETFMSESEDEGGDDTMVSSMFGKPQHVTLPYYEGQFRYTSDDTMLGDQSYRYLTVDEMKSLGDDSLPIDVTKDEKMDMSFSSNQMAAPPVAPADHLSPQHQKEHYAQMTASYPADNVDVGKTPILAGPESLNTTLNTTIDSAMIEAQIEPQIIQTKLAPQQMVENSTDLANSGSVSEKAAEILNGWEGFLVSFMVDARGGAMRGCRHSGVRVIIPPRKAAMPMRVTCRYLKKDKLVHAPPLMEGEALASRILEMGPAGAKFLGPVIIEVPHFASLRGKEREIVILRSDNGETWREHTLEATEEAVQEVLNESFDGEELKQLEDLNTNRITRILTTDFPQYFAIVTRIRQEVHAIGPEGGMVSSTVVPQVQAVFPQGALTKKIKVGLQAQPIPTDLVAKLLGNRVAVSPIVTVEPRRRKFHKPITLTIPVPQASSKGMINQYSGEAPTLRLLCSITGVFRKRSLKGGTTRAQWEDVTGSTPLTFVNDCVSFTTTVSARFWLMDCSNIPEATKMATELYREAIHVPFMAKFVVFSKRHQLEEARMRVFCMTDDREDKTLEHQELFVEVAKSRDVEVLEGKPQFLEFAGNLVPVTKSGDQLAFNFYAFRENRLPFTVRVKDQHADPIGRVAFMRQPKDGCWRKASLISLIKPPVFQVGRGDPPQTPICNLNIALPDNIQPEPAPSEPDLLALEKKYSFLSISKADTIHRANLRLTDISNMLGTDWVALAHELEVTDSDINIIKSQYPDNAPQQAIVMLRLWMQTAGNKASGNTVGKALRKINREDIVKQCIFNVEVVTDDIERAMAKAHFDQSGFDTFKDELGPSRDATLNRDVSLDVSYDEQDMMKRFKELREAESAEEEEENQRAYHDGFTQASVESSQMSSTRGTADVSFPGADTAVKQLDGAPSIFGKRPGIESFFYKGFFLPSGTHEASQPTEHQTSLPEEQAASSQPTSGTKAGSDVGVVFTERKEYGGGVKTSAETTGGHSHISPSPVLHPSQSIQSSSSTSFQQKLPCTTSVNVEDSQSSHDEPHVPSRPSRRHERTFSQATNIFTGAIPTETKVESKKVEDIKEEQIGITEDIKPYSERKQFWESVTSQSFESKSSHLLKSETESDTDTTGTDGTVLEQKVRKTKVSSTESNDSESEYLAQRVDPRFYENAGFAGTEKIDVSTESARERTISPFEVLRSEEPTDELPSPEDIAFKDVSSKRALFEKEIKRQSMEIEESQSWKRSSKEYDETLVVSEETASSTLKKKEERESKISETIEKDKEIKKKFESKKDDLSKTDFKTEITSKSDKLSSVEDRSEVTESSKLHQEKMQKKEEKVTSELGALGKKSVTQRDASTEKREKEVSEKEAKIIHEKKDSYSRTFSKSVSKSEEKTESSSEAKETVHTLSTDDQDTSKDEMTEEDITRTEETSDEEPEEKLAADKTTVDVTEESRQLGDTRETVVRETTTTREGDQEQRVVKETKTQETAMADGSTIKTTSITTFTTQLETKDQEEPKPYSAKTAKEKAEAYVKQQMKSDIFSEELSSSAEDQSPEHKVLTPKDTIAPVSREQKSHPLSSPILVPEEKIEDVVWEVSQERSETVLSETVEDIPVQQSYETQHVRDLSSDESRVLEKPQPEQATEATKHKLSEEEARKLAIEIVEEVKTEAVKRSPLVTPSQTFQEFPQEPEDTTDGATQPSLPIPIPESAFTQETTSKIEKYIQEQLGEEVDEKQLKLIESVTAKKTELLHRKLVGGQYQQSMEITDEDLRSSGAELSPIEHHMERLRQMTEEEDNQRYAREPSEADESESSIIIHDTVDDVISSEYDQATQMISKTLDSIKTADISRIERPIDTIEELPETPVMPIVEVKERKMSEVQEVARFSDSDIKETARQIVKEVTEIAKESEAVKQASQAADLKQAPGSQDQAKSCSPKSGSKPGSRKGSWMDDEDLTREFRKDYEDKKKMFKEEMTSDKSDASDAKDDGAVKVKHQKSSESQKEVPMESSMTESMEESSAVESIRSIEGKLKQEIVPEIREGETEKKHEERSSSSHEEVVMRKKTHIEEFSRRSGADFDTYSSSGESHYFTAAEGTSDSRTASRPCSSDVEALMSERTGTSEYDTALTSQDTSQYSSYSSSSREYRTAASSMSSRDSMKSIDSESSGNLASVELSEASETLVPSALELERDMDLLDQEIMEEDQSHSTQAHPSIIPQLTVQSDTPKSEGVPCAFDLESDEGESEPEVKEKEHHVASRMKRSVEMTFHPEPVPIAECKKAGVTGSVASSLEESTLSEMSVVTVVERERSLQGSFHSESSMTASAVSEQMASSSEGQPAAHPITRTDSGVLTTDTGDGDMALHSVTITATSVPSTTDSSTASMCTQVTSETRSQAELTESEQFFHANGPTEVDYVPEYDDEVRGVRPVAAPALPPVQEVSGAVAGPSEGPQKVTVVEECYETEADQEYGQMMRESEYSDMAEAELQYSLEEQPESEMSNMLGIEEPIERPKTPEPGYVPSSRPSHITAQSLDESEEFTEVDKRFSAIFSTTYEEREEGARSLVPGLSVDIPDIRVTEHTLPMPSQYCYPDLEREEDFPECQVQAEVDASGQDVPATPGSQESASTCASRKSSSTDSEQGREYCLDDAAQGLPFESFEMVEAGDIEDFLEYEKTLRMHEKRMLEMSQIQEEEEEEVEEEQKVHTSPIMPSQLKAVKLEAKSLRSSDSQSQVSDEGSEEADSTIEEQRRWLELQFEESSVSNFEYSQPPYMQHVYSGPLEDIEEEKEDAERRDLSHVVKGSSLSSTPEYDVLAGRKFFTRSGEHDDVSMSSLQEFENLERAVAVDAVARRSSSGSQESLNGRKPEGKSGQGDDISVGSFASLQEFERLEEECLEAEKIEKKAKEEEAMLSEIEEGHESQVSESESCETMSEPGQASVDGEEYDQRMFEIDEIIRQAQTNVEKFDKTKPGYEGVQLQDIVSNGSGSSRADRTPSVGREEGDADSLEEAQLPELDLDQSAPGATSTKQDVMTLSTDSIETSAKQKVPRETSQDSLEKVATRTSDPMATSVDSIDLASRHDPMTTSIDSLEGRRRGQDPMSASTDSIDPYRRDVMATSIDSLGKDDSSGRDADISSGSEQVRPLPRDGLMEWSTDSLEPTSSQATHAIYHQYDTDSVMSGSFASGCSNTLVASTEGLPDMMTSSMYLPEGELPPLEGEEQHTHYVHTSSGSAAETVAPSAEPGFSHSITRVVKLPPEAHQVTFTGPDAQKKLEEYIKGFNAGQHSVQDETVDEQGNVHIRRVTQTRIVAEPDQTQEHGFSVSEPSTVETEECDEHGNVTRVIRRTVVTSHTIEVDLDTGEPIVQPSSSTPSKSSTSASTSTFSPSISRIPRPVTSPPQSRSQQPGPPPGLRGPCEPVPPSLEPNTVSGLDVEEMSSGMEGYASDGNDPMTTTHITRYDPDPLPITTSTTTTTTTTTTTRIIRRTKEEDGEVKEEEEIFEEY
ncbi:ankyrin-2-like isoform X47 [Scylla paramamosain]|uniref:ankyrin-2-like isoform X47 n=1 Tax=Scylla paramamosain TaxID=85552 RepID=UPI003082E111